MARLGAGSGPVIFPPHATDFYKTGHIRQYPEGTTEVYSNFTPRSASWASVLPDFDNKVVWLGLQGMIQYALIDFWNAGFFHQPKADVLAYYKRRMDTSLGPNSVAIDHIEALHDLGYLPLVIKALPEGSRVNLRVPLFTVRNTAPGTMAGDLAMHWVTNYLEDQFSNENWKVPTSATTAYEYRRLLDAYADETGSPKEFVPFQGHDFSMRGMSNTADATTSGAGHLLSFLGTDTISSIDYIENYYCKDGKYPPFIGGSVPATEHSVMCMGGSEEGAEVKTFRRLINEIYPTGVVSIVSDTWDFWHVVTAMAQELKPEILARGPNGPMPGKVVFRPDSGDPVKIICGDPLAPVGTPAYKGALECLWEVFGGTTTSKGYKLLDSHVGLIYGDSITLERAQKILAGMRRKGFASGNIVFGIGSYTYQCVTRDSYGTAIKATSGVVNGVRRELFKDPKTDSGIKKSARGLLRVEKEGDNYVLYDRQTEEQEKQGLLQEVFRNGVLTRFQTWEDVQAQFAADSRSVTELSAMVA
jgi:nicotinamide phosphoribosyltransferase